MAKEKKKNKFRYFIIFVLFVMLGAGIGILGTNKFLEYNNSNMDEPVVDNSPVDITDNLKYQELMEQCHIEHLLYLVQNCPLKQ